MSVLLEAGGGILAGSGRQVVRLEGSWRTLQRAEWRKQRRLWATCRPLAVRRTFARLFLRSEVGLNASVLLRRQQRAGASRSHCRRVYERRSQSFRRFLVVDTVPERLDKGCMRPIAAVPPNHLVSQLALSR